MLSVTVGPDCNPAWPFFSVAKIRMVLVFYCWSLAYCFLTCDLELELALRQDQAGGLLRVTDA